MPRLERGRWGLLAAGARLGYDAAMAAGGHGAAAPFGTNTTWVAFYGELAAAPRWLVEHRGLTGRPTRGSRAA